MFHATGIAFDPSTKLLDAYYFRAHSATIRQSERF
jgi:hypothetical protein